MMAFHPGLYSRNLYTPDPWQTTWVPKHFPEHHYPLEHARHAVGHAFSHIAHDLAQTGFSDHAMISPRIDTRESKTAYYVDIELPGLESEERVQLKWVSSRTLLVQAVVERKGTPEDDVGPASEAVEGNGDGGAVKRENDIGKQQGKSSESKKQQMVFLTLAERRIGLYGRALDFPVDVDHDATTAKLSAGVLRLTVRKVEEEKKMDKTVSVENEGK